MVAHYAFHDIIKRGNIAPLKSFFVSLRLSVGLPQIILFVLVPLRRGSQAKAFFQPTCSCRSVCGCVCARDLDQLI